MAKIKFGEILLADGLIRGPFGSDMKKSLFVNESKDAIKVLTQENVFEEDQNLGSYFITKDYFERMKRFEVLDKDFLITCDGTLGRITFIDTLYRKSVINSSLLIIRVDPTKVDYWYFYYFWKFYLCDAITKRNVNSCLKHLPSLDVIKAEEIDIPNIEEQKRIAIFLRQYDKKINCNKRVVDVLSNKIKEIYSYWFEQFKYPGFNDNNLTKQYYKILIPKQWEIKSFLENDLWMNIKPGIHKFNGKKKYLSTSEVEQNTYVFGEDIDYFNRESRANMQPVGNSIWFAKMKKTIKHLAITNESPLIQECIFSTGLLGLKCKENSFEYLWSIINSNWFEKSKDYIASGSTQEAISEENINYLKIIIPPNELLDLYHEKTKDYLSLICQLNYENLILLNELSWFAKAFLSNNVILK